MGEAILFGRGIPVLYDPVFENNSWEKIIAYCQRGSVPEEWKVGDQKAMTINGTDYLIDIIGKDHDDYADGSGKAPLTFQMHDIYETEYPWSSTRNSTAGGWSESVIRTATLPTILALMPIEVQTAIREVSKQADSGAGKTPIVTTNDKLFFLSLQEVLSYSSVEWDAGVQYEYYKTKGRLLKYKLDGTKGVWWLRTTAANNSGYGWAYVCNTQGIYTYTFAGNASGIAPAFCF